MAGITGTLDLCSLADVSFRLTLPQFYGTTARVDTVRYECGNWFRQWPYSHGVSQTYAPHIMCENLPAPYTGQFRFLWPVTPSEATDWLPWLVERKIVAPTVLVRCVTELLAADPQGHRHGRVTVYADGEVVMQHTTTEVLTYRDLVSYLWVYRGQVDRWWGPHYLPNTQTLGVIIGPVTATVWAAEAEYHVPPLHLWNAVVQTGDDGDPAVTDSAARNWREWMDWVTDHYADLTDEELAHDTYRAEGDLWAWIPEAKLAEVYVDRGEDNAFSADDRFMMRAGYPVGEFDHGPYLRFEYYVPGGGRLYHEVTDRTYRTKAAYVASDGLRFRRVEYIRDPGTWSEPVVISSAGGAYKNPCLVDYDGRLVCWYMQDGAQQASASTDDGNNWTELTTMLGADRKNIYAIQHDGITYAVGLRGTDLVYVWSNDQGATQDVFPDGNQEIVIGASAASAVPCLVWYPDGQLRATTKDANNATVQYIGTGSGFTTWEAQP